MSIYQYRNKNVRDITDWDYSQFDSKLYLQDIKAIDWSTIHIESNDRNEIATKTIRTLQLIVNKHAPRKQISKTKQKQFSKPWITNGILKSIKNKQSMYRTHFLSNKTAKTAEYKKYANKLKHLKAVSKKAYYCKQFNLHRSSLKATWKLRWLKTVSSTFQDVDFDGSL